MQQSYRTQDEIEKKRQKPPEFLYENQIDFIKADIIKEMLEKKQRKKERKQK